MICNNHRHLQFTLRRIRYLFRSLLLCHPHCRLCNAVEIDIILTDELIDCRILRAPVILPFGFVMSLRFEIRLRKGDRRPERFRPDPDSQTLCAFEHRCRYAPFNIACQAEGYQRFARAVTDAVFCQDAAGFVAVRQLFKFNRKRGLLRLLKIIMCRHLIFERQILFFKFAFDVNDRRFQKFRDRFPHDGTDFLILLHFADPFLHQLLIIAQLEVPVCDRLHGRGLAGQRRDRIQQILRHILMS